MNVWEYLEKHDLSDTVGEGLERLGLRDERVDNVMSALKRFQVVINHRAKSRFGQFSTVKKTIELTSEYFNGDWDECKADHHNTLLHEVAHLVVHFVHKASALRVGFRAHNIEAHGNEWKSVMRAFGLEPNRCGKSDVLKEARKAKNPAGKKHAYHCDRCDYVYKCNRCLKDVHLRRHGGGCGGMLIHRQLR